MIIVVRKKKFKTRKPKDPQTQIAQQKIIK